MAVGAIPIALAVAGAVSSAAGTFIAYKGQQDAARAAEEQGRYNAKVAENSAIAAQQQAQFEADRTRERGRRLQGAQMASAAASGVDISSFNDSFFDTEQQVELDALTAEYKGKLGYNRGMDQSQLELLSGKNTAAGYRAQATGTLITGFGKTLSYAAPFIKTNPGKKTTPEF